MTIHVNVPQATFNIIWDQSTEDLAASDGFNDVLFGAGVADDTDIGIIDRAVLGNLSWQQNVGVFFWGEPDDKQEIEIAADEQMGKLTAFERFMKRGMSNVLSRKLGKATICTGFSIQQTGTGSTRLRWNENNALSLRSGAVVGSY